MKIWNYNEMTLLCREFNEDVANVELACFAFRIIVTLTFKLFSLKPSQCSSNWN